MSAAGPAQDANSASCSTAAKPQARGKHTRGPVLLSLGSVNVDFRARVDHWPAPGESRPARDVAAVAGGRAGNVAAVARRLGIACTLLGRVGLDRHADVALDPLVRAGVDVSRVIRTADARTGAGLVIVGPHGDKTMLFADNANQGWTDDDVTGVEAAVHAVDRRSVLVAALDIPAHVVEAAARACRARGVRVVLDPSRPQAMRDDLYALCDCITPDAHEASTLAGCSTASPHDALRAARRLRECGARYACVKLADGGCVVAEEAEALRLVPPRVAAIDKTGAGDAFAGALATGLLERRPMREAARIAVAAACIAVMREGSQASYPDRRKIDAMLPSIRAERMDED